MGKVHSLLRKALKTRDTALVDIAISQGADIRAKHGWAINTAINNNDVKMIEHLLKHGANISDIDDITIYNLTKRGHSNIITIILKCGVDKDKLNRALAYAVYHKDYRPATSIINYGADIYMNNYELFRASAWYGYIDNIKYFIENGYADSCACEHMVTGATIRGNLDIIKYLVDQRAVDIYDIRHTLINTAIQYGHLDIITYLDKLNMLEYQWVISAIDNAIQHGQVDIIRYFVDHGISINDYIDAIIFNTITKGYPDMMDYLVEKGIDVKPYLNIALYIAAMNDNIDMGIYLIEHGANIDCISSVPIDEDHWFFIKTLNERLTSN